MDEPQASTSTNPSLDKQPSASSLGKPKAVVWDYFIKLTAEEAKCKKCKKILKTPTGTTSGLSRHLNTHPSLATEFKTAQLTASSKQSKDSSKVKQKNIAQCFNQATQWASDSPKSLKITKQIACWMAKSFHPYSLVEEKGFKDLMKEVVPLYTVPSRTTFSRNIVPKLYDETKLKVSSILTNELEEAKSLSFTTDLWSSGSGDSYMSLTLHYLDKEFKIKRFSLGTEYIPPDDHTGLSIREKTMELLDNWQLSGLAVPKYMITDNATNMVAAFGGTGSSFLHQRCFAHSLQLCISDVKSEIKGLTNVLAKARAIVGRYKHSNKASQKLKEFQTLMNIPNHTLYQDVETRWNSEYLMLERLIEQKNAVCAEVGASGQSVNLLTPEEWLMAEAYVKILQPLHHATKSVGEDVLPTKSLEIPILHGIDKYLKTIISSQNRGIMMARSLSKSIKSRFPMYKQDHYRLLAMLIDPRFKHALLDQHEKERVHLVLKTEAKKHTELFDYPSPATPSLPTNNPSDILFSDIDDLQSQQSTPNKDELLMTQIKSYLESKPIPRSEDVGAYWKLQEYNLSLLIPVAKEFLPIPSSSIASERLFSSAGNVVTARRQKLLTKHVSELVFLHENL